VHDTRRTRMVLGVLIIAALGLITASYKAGSSSVVTGAGRLGSSALGGAESLAGSVGHMFSGAGSGGSGGQVQSLQSQVTRLRAQLSQAQLDQADYAQLHRLLALAGKGGYTVVAAQVIATAQGFQQKVTLDAGSADGVRPQETVLNGQGLVGEVTAVTAQTSTVLLATDSSSEVGIELAPSDQLGWVTGPGKTPSGTGMMQLQILDASAVLKPGQQVVTSASVNDRPYVPGVPVGVIASVQNRQGALTAKALVRPYVNFTELGVVGIVVVPPRRDPHFAVLPPAPKARPTPTVTVTVTPRAGSGPGTGTGTGTGTEPVVPEPGVSAPAAPAAGR
jgi:rod shape-determining protein MreC